MRNILVSVLVAVLIGAVVYVLSVYVLVDDETRIERRIEKGRRAIEEESLLTLATLIAEDYHDEFGQDRAMVLGGLRSFFQSTENLKIHIKSRNINVDESNVEAHIEFAISGEIGGERLKDLRPDETVGVTIFFSERGGSWKVIGLSRFQEVPR